LQNLADLAFFLNDLPGLCSGFKGWVGKHTKTLLNVYLLNSNFAIWFTKEDSATGASTGDDCIITAPLAWRLRYIIPNVG